MSCWKEKSYWTILYYTHALCDGIILKSIYALNRMIRSAFASLQIGRAVCSTQSFIFFLQFSIYMFLKHHQFFFCFLYRSAAFMFFSFSFRFNLPLSFSFSCFNMFCCHWATAVFVFHSWMVSMWMNRRDYFSRQKSMQMALFDVNNVAVLFVYMRQTLFAAHN